MVNLIVLWIDVRNPINCKDYTLICATLHWSSIAIVMRMIDIVVGIVSSTTLYIDFFMNIYQEYICESIKWICIKLKSIFTYIITLFSRICRALIKSKDLFINCMVNSHNNHNSCYEMVYCNCITILHSIMITVSNIASKSMIHHTIKFLEEYLCVSDVEYCGNKLEVDRQAKYCDFYYHAEYASINNEYSHSTKTLDIGGINMYVLMIQLLIKDVLHVMALINMSMLMYFQFVVVYFVIYKVWTFRYVFEIILHVTFNLVIVIMDACNAHMDSLVDTFPFLRVNQMIVIIHIKSQSTFILIITISTQLYNILRRLKQLFIDDVVNRYVTNNGLHYTTVCFHYLMFVYSTIMIMISKSIIYIITQWMEQNFNDLHDKHDENKSHIDDLLHCQSMNIILTCIVSVICSIHLIHSMIDQLTFTEMILYSNISHIHTNMGLLVVVSCLWYAIIRCRHSRICYFMDIYTIYNHDTIIQTTYVDFQKILTSIIIFIQESNMLLNCIVIATMVIIIHVINLFLCVVYHLVIQQ